MKNLNRVRRHNKAPEIPPQPQIQPASASPEYPGDEAVARIIETLPDSLQERRRILESLIAATPKSHPIRPNLGHMLTNLVSQILDEQDIPLILRLPAEPQPQRPKPSVSDEELERYKKHRKEQMRLLGLGLLNFDLQSVCGWREWPDSVLLQYVSDVIGRHENVTLLTERILPELDELRHVSQFMEALKISECLSGSEKLPSDFPLPGLAGTVAFTVSDALFFICDVLHEHWQLVAEALKSVRDGGDPIGAMELAEVLLISEAVTERAGGNTALVSNNEGATEIQQLCWQMRAVCLLGEKANLLKPGLIRLEKKAA
jgi:hypothetical protein